MQGAVLMDFNTLIMDERAPLFHAILIANLSRDYSHTHESKAAAP